MTGPPRTQRTMRSNYSALSGIIPTAEGARTTTEGAEATMVTNTVMNIIMVTLPGTMKGLKT